MDYHAMNDYEILYLITEHNDEALKIMLEKYRPIVIALAKKHNQKITKLGIEFQDLIQEGMIGLVQAIKSFNNNDNSLFYTFACLCIERHLNGYIKKLSRHKHQILNNAVSIDDGIYNVNFESYAVADISFEPYNVIECDETFNFLINFKHSLTFNYANIFELRINGFSYKEIALLLDKSWKYIDNALYRIKIKLIDSFEHQFN